MKQPTNLRLQLLLNGKSQKEVADEANVSITCINRVVWGVDRPSDKVKSAFCKVLNLPKEILFEGGSKKAS